MYFNSTRLFTPYAPFIPTVEKFKQSKRAVVGRIQQVVGPDVLIVDYLNDYQTKKAETGMLIAMYDGITIPVNTGNHVTVRLQNGVKLQLLNMSQALFFE